MKELADEPENDISISAICVLLDVNRKSYYNYLKYSENSYQIRRKELGIKIKAIHDESKQIYGAPKITRKLRKQGQRVSEKHVGNIMRAMGLKAHYVKQKAKTTINSDLSPTLKNEINRVFNPEKPNAIWCTDITYIRTLENRFVYLTSVMDLYSRKIIAWTLSQTLETHEVLQCLEEAKRRRHMDEPVVIHSDRGSHFVSNLYKELTKDMVTSYSKKADPWDNAPIESFHALIKREWLNRFKPLHYYHAKQLVFEYIEGFYNNKRIHSFCGYLSPNERELLFMNSLSH